MMPDLTYMDCWHYIRRAELASRRNALLVVVEKYLGLINCSVLHAKRMDGDDDAKAD